MDGGGIRGRCLLAMVEEMEQLLGGPVASHFDLIAGTSIGGCGSIFLSRYPEPGRATRMGRRALTELQNRCFAQTNWQRLLRQGFLCRDARREFMIELCGPTQPLRTNGPRAFAVAAQMCKKRGGRLEAFLFRTYDLPRDALKRSTLQGTTSVALWQAVEATSAAPVLFPRARLELDVALDEEEDAGSGEGADADGGVRPDGGVTTNEEAADMGDMMGGPTAGGGGARTKATTVWLADGGLVANDPTVLALREARALWPDRPIGTVVSLGTGCASPLGADDDDEPARSPVAKAVRACGGPSARYYRFNPPVTGVSLMDSNEAKLRAMEDVTRKFFRESLDAREACFRLVESRARRRSASWRSEWPIASHAVGTWALARAWLMTLLMALLEAFASRCAAWRWALVAPVNTRSSSTSRLWLSRRAWPIGRGAPPKAAAPAFAMP